METLDLPRQGAAALAVSQLEVLLGAELVSLNDLHAHEREADPAGEVGAEDLVVVSLAAHAR